MGLPNLWTEPTLIGAVEAELEPVTAALGLDSLDVVATAVGTDVPAVLGVASVAAITYGSVADVVKVLTIARWAAWQKAVDVASVRFDLKAGSADLKQSQVWQQLMARLASAERAALRYDEVRATLAGGGVAYVTSIGGVIDPSRWMEWG
jgi:hypothetical protein